jgi:hypothetical protein
MTDLALLKKKPAAKPGRPASFTAELATEICRRLAVGGTLRAVCRDRGMPPESTVREWALADRDGFAAQYARAREIGYQAMADELPEIADDGRNDSAENVARSRLRVDTRKWLLSKALPKVFGDALQVTGKIDSTTSTGAYERVMAKLKNLRERIDARALKSDEAQPGNERLAE